MNKWQLTCSLIVWQMETSRCSIKVMWEEIKMVGKEVQIDLVQALPNLQNKKIADVCFCKLVDYKINIG